MKSSEQDQKSTRKTIYDGIKMTKRGADIIIALLSVTLTLLFIFALSKN